MTNLFGEVPVNTNENNGGSSSENEQESNAVTEKSEPSGVRKVPVNATSPRTGESNPILVWLSGVFKAAGF